MFSRRLIVFAMMFTSAIAIVAASAYFETQSTQVVTKSAPILLSTNTSVTSAASASLLVRRDLQEILTAAGGIKYGDFYVNDGISQKKLLIDYSEVEHRRWRNDEFMVPGNPELYVVVVPLVPLGEQRIQEGRVLILVEQETCIETASTAGNTIRVYCETTTVQTWKYAADCGWLKLFVTPDGAVYYGGMFLGFCGGT